MRLYLTTSDKGGLLKTTFTAMLADWASRHQRHAVLVDAEGSTLQRSASSIAKNCNIPVFKLPAAGKPFPVLSCATLDLADKDFGWAGMLNKLASIGFNADLDFFVDTGAAQLTTLTEKLPLLESLRQEGLDVVTLFMIGTNDDSCAAARHYLKGLKPMLLGDGPHVRTVFILTSSTKKTADQFDFTTLDSIQNVLAEFPHDFETIMLGMLPPLIYSLVYDKRLLPGTVVGNRAIPFGLRAEVSMYVRQDSFGKIARKVLGMAEGGKTS